MSLAEVLLRAQPVVSVAQHLQVPGAIEPTSRPRLSMMKLQKRARLAALPVVSDERATRAVARQDLTANTVRDVLTLLRCTGLRFAGACGASLRSAALRGAG